MAGPSVLATYGESASLREIHEWLRSRGDEVQLVLRPEGLDDAAHAGCTAFVVHLVGELPAFFAQLCVKLGRKLILFIEHPTEADLRVLARQELPRTLVLKQGVFSAVEMQVAISRVIDGTPFGLEYFLSPGASIERLTLLRSVERGEALRQVERHTAGLTLDPRRIAHILSVADELLTNAFYHAPVDKTGRHHLSHLSRIDPVECRADTPVELAFAHDDQRIAVAVRDRYGSIDARSALGHLAKVTTDPKATFRVAPGSGGARLGLVTAFRATSRLLFDIAPNRSTECIGVIEIGGNYREFLAGGKSLYLCTGSN